ncbi:MAG: hypothetical protein ACLTU3_05635 [Acutalibacteraceae bacterium]
MKKNSGTMLTLEKARMLAVQEFGTDRGLSEYWCMQGGYIMQFGNLLIRIHPATQRDIPVIKVEVCFKIASPGCGSIVKIFNPETFEEDLDAEREYRQMDWEESLENWVDGYSAEICHQKINGIVKGHVAKRK